MGFRKGLLLELVSLLALVVGFIGGIKLLTVAIPIIRGVIGDVHGLLPFVSFLLVFVLIILCVKVMGFFLKKLLDFTPFGLFDNVLGAFLGALKWCMAISLLLYVSGMAGISISDATEKTSVVYPVVQKTTPLAMSGISFVLPFVKTLFVTLKGLF